MALIPNSGAAQFLQLIRMQVKGASSREVVSANQLQDVHFHPDDAALPSTPGLVHSAN